MIYVIEDADGQKHEYGFSYTDLQDEYRRLTRLSDEDFVKELPAAAHFAVFVAWFKEMTHWACSDTGIVHELIHLMHIPDGNTRSLQSIREQFAKDLLLA